MNMMQRKIYAIAIAALMMATTSLADDVEIYFSQSSLTSGEPLVMFSLDYRPNLGSSICNFGAIEDCGWGAEINNEFSVDDRADGTIDFLEMLRAALRRVLSQVSGLRVGLMLNHDNVNKCAGQSYTKGCSNGGYIAQGFESIDGNLSANGGEDHLLQKLADLPSTQGNVSHPYQGKELYFEFFRYLTGQGIYNGHVGQTDYADPCILDNLNSVLTPSVGCAVDDDAGALVSWDTKIEESAEYDEDVEWYEEKYISPFSDPALECSSVYALNFMFGVTNQEDDSDDAITNSINGLRGIDLSGKRNHFGTVIEWMANHDLADGKLGAAPEREGTQDVTSYFLYKGNVQNTMNGYAIAGGTGQALEITDDPQELIDNLTGIFKQILRQNSTFEAPAVTVNSYTRLTHRDELYYALFGPEDTPDWPGNLKKYKLANLDIDTDGDGISDSTVVRVVDRNNRSAVDQGSGVFEPTACSFWSDCSIDRDADGLADADGDTVAWGGAGERLTIKEDLSRPRKAYTDTGSTKSLTDSSNVLHEDNGDITAAMLGIDATNATDMDEDGDVDASDVKAQRDRLIKLGRGFDPVTGQSLKSLGDPIHARPSVIVYDADLSNAGINPDMAIAMTTNHGSFHLIDAETGNEYFSYTPREELSLIKKIYGPHPFDPNDAVNRFSVYGLDGSPLVWLHDDNSDGVVKQTDGDRVLVYLTQRRGGRNIYALDITDRSKPAIVWKILGGVTAGFSELGQTWSEPQMTTIKVGGVGRKVLVFGGGYDDAQDDAYSRADAIGRAIYVVDAETGALVWTVSNANSDMDIASMQNGIPANVRVLDVDEDGYLDRIYAVDVIGRVFRVDFKNTGVSTAIYGSGLIASLFPIVCNDISCQRRFYNAPDIAVMVGSPYAPYVQIAVGSGYRAHPVSVKGIQDRFYTLFDHNVVDPLLSSAYGAGQQYHWVEDINVVNVTDSPDGSDYDTVNNTVQALLAAADVHGWYINMDVTKQEKVLSESVTIQGKVIFTTYLRDNSVGNSCEPNLGQGRLYVIDAFTGLPVADLYTGEGVKDLSQVKKEHRFKQLARTGIPSDPLIIFRKTKTGDVTPTVVVTTELPLPENILGKNLYTKTWWIDLEN